MGEMQYAYYKIKTVMHLYFQSNTNIYARINGQNTAKADSMLNNSTYRCYRISFLSEGLHFFD